MNSVVPGTNDNRSKGTTKTTGKKDTKKALETPSITDFFPAKQKTKTEASPDPPPKNPVDDKSKAPAKDDWDDSDDGSYYGLYEKYDKPTETPEEQETEQIAVDSSKAKSSRWSGLYKKPFSSPKGKKSQSTPKETAKRKEILESEEEEWASDEDADMAEESTKVPARKKAKTSPKKTETAIPNRPEKVQGPSLVADGLGSSDEDDDKFIDAITPKHVKEKLEGSEQKSKSSEKLRIKISMKEVEKTPEGKCRCKKECTGHCGCVKQGRKCSVACACRGTCRNGRSP